MSEPTELLHRQASSAWAAMVAPQFTLAQALKEHDPGPMPPGVALDMVQDVCDDRALAMRTLVDTASDWLDDQRPADSARPSVNNLAATGFAALLCLAARSKPARHLNKAEELLVSTRELVIAQQGSPIAAFVHDYPILIGWSRWCDDAEHALRLCRELIQLAQLSEQSP